MGRQKRRYNLRSIIMILLIIAFIVGAAIGISQVLDFNISSDDNNNTTIVYEDVTHNVSYYENESSSQVDNSSDDDGDYADSNLKVYNASQLNKNAIK